jgi:hypothetical protein
MKERPREDASEMMTRLMREGELPGFGRRSVKTLAAIDGRDIQTDYSMYDDCRVSQLSVSAEMKIYQNLIETTSIGAHLFLTKGSHTPFTCSESRETRIQD